VQWGVLSTPLYRVDNFSDFLFVFVGPYVAANSLRGNGANGPLYEPFVGGLPQCVFIFPR